MMIEKRRGIEEFVRCDGKLKICIDQSETLKSQ